MNILVFGKDGQLGGALQKQLLQPSVQHNHLSFVGRSECDLDNFDQLTYTLNAHKPDLIINAAAYTAVDKAEVEPDLAFSINAVAPSIMANYAVQHHCALLHFSTDYIFDGSKQGTYTENDMVNPLGIYGKSKQAGEDAIVTVFAQHSTAQYAIFRTSWVYGDGGNFIRTILRLAKERPALKVIDDQFGVPTNAEWLADVAMHFVLDRDHVRPFNSGIYHAAPVGETSWYGLACLAAQVALESGQQLQMLPAEITPIPASEYPLPAPRPMNSRLSRDKLQMELERLAIVSKLPHWNTPWSDQVAAYVKKLSDQ